MGDDIKKIIISISIVVFSLSLTNNASATGITYSVPSSSHSTIASAITACPATGCTINVAPGSGYPAVNTSKSNVSIVCTSPRECIGIQFTFYGSNNSIINFKIKGGTQTGVYLFGTGHRVEGNEITGTVGDGDGIRAFGSGHTIRGNYIHDPVPVSGAHTDCFQTWTENNNTTYVSVHDFLFENNTCVLFGTITAGLQLEGDVHNAIVRHNTFEGHAGIRGYYQSPAGPSNIGPHHNTIEYNVFKGGLNYALNTSPVGITMSDGHDNTLRNNIILDQPKHTLNLVGANNVASHNLSWNSDGSTPPAANIISMSSLWKINPMLGTDYHPQNNSPVCGAGLGGTDIGAFPCSNTGSIPSSSPSPTTKLGDLNNDGHINQKDFILVQAQFGNPYTIFDYNNLVANYEE